MQIDKTLVARARGIMLSSFSDEIIEYEAYKCSCRNISSFPVRLEPLYTPPNHWINNEFLNNPKSIYQVQNTNFEKQISLNCWISPNHKLDWIAAERFIKILKGIKSRILFNIMGNNDEIKFQFIIYESDFELFKVAFNSSYLNCETTNDRISDFRGQFKFFDYFPKVPYHNLLTRASEFTFSPFEIIINALLNLNNSEYGFSQIIFEPVRNNWHHNVEVLTDLEYLSSVMNSAPNSKVYNQQTPSIEMRHMANEVIAKAHNDKPFYFVGIRTGLWSTEDKINLSGLVSYINLFQMGGQELEFISQEEYLKNKTKQEIFKMFFEGQCYRCGFLLNSYELSGLVHIPTVTEFYSREFPLCYLESRELFSYGDNIKSGIVIGESTFAGMTKEVLINDQIRKTSTHLIGRSGSGKSTEMEHMILQDIKNNSGLAFLDPHGDSIKRILKLIPEEKVESTIYIDFGDPNWIPIWNPLRQSSIQDVGRIADDLVNSVKNIIKGNAWGDRLEHLLRNGFFGLLHLPDSTFYDLIVLFEYSKIPSKEKQKLVQEISQLVNNPVAERFWKKDLGSYGKEDFRPPHHKLSKFLNSDETISLMLTQSESYLDLKQLINSENILLFDLSSIGTDTRRIIGSYLFTLLHKYSLSRSKIDIKDRSSFNIYCDEAHKLTTDSLEDMIIETRKFGVNLTLAHQYLNQFNDSQRDALLSMGSTIIFNVDLHDAKMLVKDLQNKVNPSDISTLKTGEAIARIGTKIVKIKTKAPLDIPQKTFEKEILKRSREKYYLPISEVKNRIQLRLKDFHFNEKKVYTSSIQTNELLELFKYDEFK